MLGCCLGDKSSSFTNVIDTNDPLNNNSQHLYKQICTAIINQLVMTTGSQPSRDQQ